jgi:pheromone shutdown protein TraB
MEDILKLLASAYIVVIVWKWERDDWYKIEDIRKDILKKTQTNNDDIIRIMNATERMRRVTWRMGICGAAILAFILIQCNIISWSQFIAAAVPCWILITSVLNFRAYHLEDEQTTVLRHVLNQN